MKNIFKFLALIFVLSSIPYALACDNTQAPVCWNTVADCKNCEPIKETYTNQCFMEQAWAELSYEWKCIVLTSRLEDKLDDSIMSFMENLKSEYPSISERVTKIDQTVIKLKELAELKPRYREIVDYVGFRMDYISKEVKVQQEIIAYYWLDVISDNFLVDSKADCEAIISKYTSSTIDCTKSSDGQNYWDIWIIISSMGNNFYDVYLWSLYPNGESLIREIYDASGKNAYTWTLTDNNFWFINIGSTNSSSFNVLTKTYALFNNSLILDSHIENSTLWTFGFAVQYRFKDWLSDYDKLKLLDWDFPYYMYNYDIWLWISWAYDLLKGGLSGTVDIKNLTVFWKQWDYFTNEWGTDTTNDIFILTADIPNNPYFSEFVIQFFDTWAYNDSSKEQLLVDFVKNLQWQTTFAVK